MAAATSILAWRIPWVEEPGGLQSVALQSQTLMEQLSTPPGALSPQKHHGCQDEKSSSC